MNPGRLLPLMLLVLPAVAAAQGEVCSAPAVPLERQVRQLYLDLLNRPPTVEEYSAAREKGEISPEDIRALLASEDFYARMRRYHRALFRSNISASVYNNNDSTVAGTGEAGSPYAMTDNQSDFLRGVETSCNAFIRQETCNDSREDPHSEPGTKTCFDSSGVPLPVSYDYDTVTYYTCTQLDAGDATVTDCPTAVTRGLLADKQLYFCDMRRDAAGALHPWSCRPDPAKPGGAVLTAEELDGSGRVVAYFNPAATGTRVERCTLNPSLIDGIRGAYAPQRGCVQREGWTMAPAPFWEPTGGRTQVASCAIEAQTRAVNPSTLESCETRRFLRDRSCGCGANFRRCEPRGRAVHNARIAALNQEPELIADSVLRRDEPYFNIISSRRSFVNGPLSQLYRQQQGTGVFNVSAPAAPETIPDIPYQSTETWQEFTRDSQHSGVLTSPSYLFRFATWRSRISNFYEAMLCTHFSPPPGTVFPAPEDACNRENNLATRCGCSTCHATIEPTGAHWGRFGERSATYLEPEQFPRFSQKCFDCAVAGNVSCGGECGDYVMQAYDGAGAESLGLLKTFLYRTHPEEVNIEAGPRLLVERMMATGELDRCTVRRMWTEFLGRPMTQQEEQLYLAQLVSTFVSNNWRLKPLIEQIVTSDAYRRVD
ncbi:MAG: DUF1585 domain-containing protein [Myxococcota bacterium]|nr:DUF1585 domain-containing protein [Myxococcota bacterium]